MRRLNSHTSHQNHLEGNLLSRVSTPKKAAALADTTHGCRNGPQFLAPNDAASSDPFPPRPHFPSSPTSASFINHDVPARLRPPTRNGVTPRLCNEILCGDYLPLPHSCGLLIIRAPTLAAGLHLAAVWCSSARNRVRKFECRNPNQHVGPQAGTSERSCVSISLDLHSASRHLDPPSSSLDHCPRVIAHWSEAPAFLRDRLPYLLPHPLAACPSHWSSRLPSRRPA